MKTSTTTLRVLVWIAFGLSTVLVEAQTLLVSNGGPWGEWGAAVYCPSGKYAMGYRMRVRFFCIIF